MNLTLTTEQKDTLRVLQAKAETGEQWAEICRIESEFLKANLVAQAKRAADWIETKVRAYCGQSGTDAPLFVAGDLRDAAEALEAETNH